MFAVIKTGGKQYRVAENDTLEIERLAGEPGDILEFKDVLMVGSDAGVEVGAPLVDGATVAAELVDQTRGDKIIIFKKKRRKHYRRKNGHRQLHSLVRITEILTGGKKPSKKAAAKPKAEAKEEKTAASAQAAEEAPAPAKKPAKKAAGGDDLTEISGVGPVIVGKLADLGYTTFQQIADMTPEQIAEVDEKLNFKGRIEREGWVEQAKELAAKDK